MDGELLGIIIVAVITIVYVIGYHKKTKKEIDEVMNRPLTEEEKEEEERHAREIYMNAFSDKLSEEQKEELFEKIYHGSIRAEKIPADYLKYRYPIDNWNYLCPEDLKKAEDEWNHMEMIVTDDHYRLFGLYIFLRNNQKICCKGYVEIRYSGDYPNVEALAEFEETLIEKMRKKKYNDEEEAQIGLKKEVEKLLNDTRIGVTITDVIVMTTAL